MPLGFIHERNILFNHMGARPGASMPEDLRMIAVSRLFLRPLDHEHPDELGEDGSTSSRQQGLMSAAPTTSAARLMEESISRESGSQHGENTSPEDFRRLIREAGRVPVERSTTYKVLRRFEDPTQDPPSLEDARDVELSGPARYRQAPKPKGAAALRVISG